MSTAQPDYPRAGIYVEKDDSWDEFSWTAVPNAILRDPKLGWDSKAAYGWLASHSKTFTLKAESLAEAGPMGRNHARAMLRELEEHGWLSRSRRRNPQTGRYDVFVYKLHPVPVAEEARTFTKSTAKTRAFPQVKPAPAQSGAGPAEDPDLFANEFEHALNPQASPATDQPGTGQPGAGQPVTGRADVSRARLSVTKETTEGDQNPREPAREADAGWAADPQGAPDVFMRQADIDAERHKQNRRNGSAVAMNGTARSQPALRIVSAFAKSLPRQLPNSELAKLGRGVDEAFELGWTEDEIVHVGLPHWNRSGKGAHLFVAIASEVVSRGSVSKLSTADQSVINAERLRAELAADPHQSFLEASRPRAISGGSA